MGRALVVVNPIAGRGLGERRLGDVEHGLRRMGMATTVVVTERSGDARRAAADAEAHDLVVVVGGDGTLNEVVNGIEADRPVALFPLGTGNVLGKEFRLPRRPERFCAMVARGRERALDLGSANGRRFVAMAGAGFDAEVAAEFAAARRGPVHKAHYVLPLLRCLSRYRFPRIAVSIDGAAALEAQGFALVSSVRSFGGPFVITPDAAPDDGVLDICLLRRGGPWRYARAMLACMLRCQHALAGASYFRGRSIHLAADEPVRYQVDGDAAGFLPVAVELLARKLRFIVP